MRNALREDVADWSSWQAYHVELVTNFSMKIITAITARRFVEFETQEQVSKPQLTFTIEAKL